MTDNTHGAFLFTTISEISPCLG